MGADLGSHGSASLYCQRGLSDDGSRNAAWLVDTRARLPPGLLASADGTLHVEHYVRSAQIAERGKLDMIFFADGAGIRQGDIPHGSLSRTGRDMLELEPMTLLRPWRWSPGMSVW